MGQYIDRHCGNRRDLGSRLREGLGSSYSELHDALEYGYLPGKIDKLAYIKYIFSCPLCKD